MPSSIKGIEILILKVIVKNHYVHSGSFCSVSQVVYVLLLV